MNIHPLHLLANLKRKAARLPLYFTSNEGGKCGTQNLTNREAWLEHTLANIPSGQRILDAGAGEREYKRFCAHLEYVSQDFNQYDGRGDGKGLQEGKWNNAKIDIVSDITNIPEADAAFHAVMCIEVLEHLPEPIRALRELTRLLKPCGMLIITAPFCSLTHLSPYFFQTGYSRYFYEYWLKELGYEILDMRWNGNYFEYLAQELRRLPWVGKEFACGSMNWIQQIALNHLLKTLNRFSDNDQGSEQLLAYGLHVVARKK